MSFHLEKYFGVLSPQMERGADTAKLSRLMERMV